jgi:hypothetical protein
MNKMDDTDTLRILGPVLNEDGNDVGRYEDGLHWLIDGKLATSPWVATKV